MADEKFVRKGLEAYETGQEKTKSKLPAAILAAILSISAGVTHAQNLTLPADSGRDGTEEAAKPELADPQYASASASGTDVTIEAILPFGANLIVYKDAHMIKKCLSIQTCQLENQPEGANQYTLKSYMNGQYSKGVVVNATVDTEVADTDTELEEIALEENNALNKDNIVFVSGGIADKATNLTFGNAAKAWTTLFPEASNCDTLKSGFNGCTNASYTKKQGVDIYSGGGKLAYNYTVGSNDNLGFAMSLNGRVDLIEGAALAGEQKAGGGQVAQDGNRGAGLKVQHEVADLTFDYNENTTDLQYFTNVGADTIVKNMGFRFKDYSMDLTHTEGKVKTGVEENPEFVEDRIAFEVKNFGGAFGDIVSGMSASYGEFRTEDENGEEVKAPTATYSVTTPGGNTYYINDGGKVFSGFGVNTNYGGFKVGGFVDINRRTGKDGDNSTLVPGLSIGTDF